MRIGIVSATYLPSRNGVATSTALFARGLRTLGHEVRVFAPQHPRQDRTSEDDGVWRLPTTSIGAPDDYPLLLWPSVAVTARLPLADLDVIHTMHPFLSGQLALRWARRLRVPLVFTAHTQYHEYLHYTRLPRRLTRRLLKRHVSAFASASDAVLAPGLAMEDMLRRYGYGGGVTRLPNPVDLSSYSVVGGDAVRARHGLPSEAPVLIYLGRLAHEKNLDVLLEAFGQALTARPDLRLLVVGDGPARAGLERQARDLPVVFAGAVEYARVPEYLAAADAFVTASTSEVLPMSMIEALAAGAPLLAARSPAAEDLVRDGVNGVLCEPGAGPLAAGMIRVLTSGELGRLREGARRSALAYDVTARARDLVAVYEAVRRDRNPRVGAYRRAQGLG